MISAVSLSKSFGGHPVLHDINLQIAPRELLCLLGRSGTGKSTLLHMLAGMERPSSGQVIVDGQSLYDASRDARAHYRRNIGVVFQDFRLLPGRSALENLEYVLQAAGFSDAAIPQLAQQALLLAGLGHRAHALVHQLSGGERQRLALARAVVHRPRVLFADEPTGNLDPDMTEQVARILLHIHEQGTAIVLSTHDESLVSLLRGRVVLLHDGAIAADRRTGSYLQHTGTAVVERVSH